MTVNQLRSELAKLREELSPKTSKYHLIIYDHHLCEGDEIPFKALLKIDGQDVTMLTDVEKANLISGADTLLYLPEKDPLSNR
jgi:hypothetical protein